MLFNVYLSTCMIEYICSIWGYVEGQYIEVKIY